MSDQRSQTARLLWGPHPKPSRGPKPALSLDRIARAGSGIADAEGLPAVSMQRVAGLLDVTKMALYRYVPGKAELVALMVETAIGEAPLPNGPRPDWREQLSDWARRLVTVFHRHPWLLDATVGPRVMGPRELAWMEQALAALDGTGLTDAERMDAVVLLAGHVRGIAQQARAAGPAGSPEAQFSVTLGELMQAHGEDYPPSPPRRPRRPSTAGRTRHWSSACSASWTAWAYSSPSVRTDQGRLTVLLGLRHVSGVFRLPSWSAGRCYLGPVEEHLHEMIDSKGSVVIAGRGLPPLPPGRPSAGHRRGRPAVR
ncbi:AcrR family transcriptional regulator [Streptomyces sp. V4I23]|uniref:TetR/AcrR family transcriptional regulator n=1 Tax=Streptomyces sp. V4I23 TaxID=3042282 RepID=UPI00277D3AD9|nr:TetR/AcrR family transcriptional regulator C-terminal domain-containing protein [Streptomyces sp. V4I23]MDQ1006156.1 AcrR family transcriptional regulator [Streptomyces sp. V4I23]